MLRGSRHAGRHVPLAADAAAGQRFRQGWTRVDRAARQHPRPGRRRDGRSILLLTGVFATNFVGQWCVAASGHRLLNRIPVVKSIYSSVKQVSDTLFSSSGNAFRKAVLVQYPRAGVWTIAFVTGTPGGEVATHLHGDYLSVYVPTTPNPTSGFFLMLPRSDVHRAGDERRRGAEVHHLDGRGRAAAARADPALPTRRADRRNRPG